MVSLWITTSIHTEAYAYTAFYKVFWSLQLPFSRPPVFAGTLSVADFRTAVEAILPRLKEATAHDRALAGGKAVHEGTTGTKRKRASDAPDAPGVSDYFFAKFLTSPELLDLEVRLFASTI